MNTVKNTFTTAENVLLSNYVSLKDGKIYLASVYFLFISVLEVKLHIGSVADLDLHGFHRTWLLDLDPDLALESRSGSAENECRSATPVDRSGFIFTLNLPHL